MTINSATEFCKLVEARLGWAPPDFGPPYTRYQTEAAKVKRKVAKDPFLYTWANLELAVELCVREKRHIVNPLGVFYHVTRAVEMANTDDDAVEAAIQAAMRVEGILGDPDGWVVRFSRAQGHYRLQALREWEAGQ
jgi:hypothetical protein